MFTNGNDLQKFDGRIAWLLPYLVGGDVTQ